MYCYLLEMQTQRTAKIEKFHIQKILTAVSVRKSWTRKTFVVNFCLNAITSNLDGNNIRNGNNY